MKNRILIPLFGLAILSVIISVFVGHRKETAAAKGAIVGYDDLGKKIVLPKVPERVVVLNRLTLLHNRKLHVQGKPEDVLTPANLGVRSKITSHFRISASGHIWSVLIRKIREIARYSCGFAQSDRPNLNQI